VSASLRVERAVEPGVLATFLHALGQQEPPAPEAECWVAYRGHEIAACLGTYALNDLTGAPGRCGLIGHFGAREADAAVRLLHEAADSLRSRGALRVIGPMNGSTWARYRFVAAAESPEEADEPAYLSEPTNLAEYPAYFAAAGFSPIIEYESRIQRDLSIVDPKAAPAVAKVADAGIHIEPLALDRFVEVLGEIHALSLESFVDNPFYRPIERDAFIAMYTPMRPILDPDFVQLARDATGALVGFVFAFVDPLGAAHGAPGRVVLKTLVTAPALRGLGLGALLVDRTRSLALAKGHRAVIHALMHVSNVSKRMSERTTTRFRRYQLYEWAKR
jgi:GNAT superfamily N-acetyltransferase